MGVGRERGRGGDVPVAPIRVLPTGGWPEVVERFAPGIGGGAGGPMGVKWEETSSWARIRQRAFTATIKRVYSIPNLIWHY